jgi:hypothetical protein
VPTRAAVATMHSTDPGPRVIGDAATSVTFRSLVGKRLKRCAAGSRYASLRTACKRGQGCQFYQFVLGAVVGEVHSVSWVGGSLARPITRMQPPVAPASALAVPPAADPPPR